MEEKLPLNEKRHRQELMDPSNYQAPKLLTHLKSLMLKIFVPKAMENVWCVDAGSQKLYEATL